VVVVEGWRERKGLKCERERGRGREGEGRGWDDREKKDGGIG
jgi:hypothetical protein